MASRPSLDILWHRMREGDLILCWQTDRRRAVGLCRVDSLDDWTDDDGEAQRQMRLELIGEPFSPPVELREAKKHDAGLAAVRAFKQGRVSTLYDTTPAEGQALLRACGISPRTLSRLMESPSRDLAPAGGAGFGSHAENRKVEAAAVEALIGYYEAKGWTLSDRQKDKMGYDFEAVRGAMRRNIELKGTRGPAPSFPITRHEVETARVDPDWWLAVVTDALSDKPRVYEWRADEFLDEFDLWPLSYVARRK